MNSLSIHVAFTAIVPGAYPGDDDDDDTLRLTDKLRLRHSGVYVASVVHHEGRVLVTSDGRVPMVEVDEAASVSDVMLAAEYYWLLKVGPLLPLSA